MLLKDKPVTFVYVSIDNDTAADRSITQKYHIDGIFTHANGGWYANEVQLYGVQKLPAYFLIDEDGNFGLQPPPTPPHSAQLAVEIGKLIR